MTATNKLTPEELRYWVDRCERAERALGDAGEFEKAAHQNGRLLWKEQQRADRNEQLVEALKAALVEIREAASSCGGAGPEFFGLASLAYRTADRALRAVPTGSSE